MNNNMRDKSLLCKSKLWIHGISEHILLQIISFLFFEKVKRKKKKFRNEEKRTSFSPKLLEPYGASYSEGHVKESLKITTEF